MIVENHGHREDLRSTIGVPAAGRRSRSVRRQRHSMNGHSPVGVPEFSDRGEPNLRAKHELRVLRELLWLYGGEEIRGPFRSL